VAQVLLTRDDLSQRSRYLNAKNTLSELLRHGLVPVINENDTVAVEEIKFGDNDTLAVLAAHLVEADLVVLLTDTDGLYDRDPRGDREARLVHDVWDWDPALESAAGGSRSMVGTGGMLSKVKAAKQARKSGIPLAILGGEVRDVLVRFFKGEGLGTLFHAPGERMGSQERWLTWGSRPRGAVVVDDGARKALVERRMSLLPTGVKGVRGHWEAGEAVRIEDASGKEVARGVCSYSSEETDRIKGLRSADAARRLGRPGAGELVHRDRLVLMDEL
jgi:glutamate 5-kinase